MVHKIAGWLKDCPAVEDITVGTLPPGKGTGIFPKGITRVRQDILGGSAVTSTVVLRHRGRPEDRWPQELSGWVFHTAPPAGCTVTPHGGRLCSPTKDGWGTWELELTVAHNAEWGM